MNAIESSDTAAELIGIAARQVASGGLESLTMDALAEEAGVSRATIYRRVGGRAEIVSRLVAEGRLDASVLEEHDVPTRVLEALRDVLEDEGMSGTTVERVAEAAGVSPATVYRRFGDRAGLFAAYAERFSPRRTADELLCSADRMEDALTHLATETLRFMRQNSSLVRLRLSGDPETRRLLGGRASTQERMVPKLARYFEQQIAAGELAPADPFQLAMAFGGLVTGFGLVADEHHGGDIPDVEVSAATIVRIFLEGARPRGVGESGGAA